MEVINVFDVSKLVPVVTLVLALSLASERLVEIAQAFLPLGLNQRQGDARTEARRRAKIQALAIVAGLLTALLATPLLVTDFRWQKHIWVILGLGLLASGGSSLWNSILGYLNGVKQKKECEVEQQRQTVQAEAEAEAGSDRIPRAA